MKIDPRKLDHDSWQHKTKVRLIRKTKLSMAMKAVLVAINEAPRGSREALIQNIGCTPKTFDRCVRNLGEMGFLESAPDDSPASLGFRYSINFFALAQGLKAEVHCMDGYGEFLYCPDIENEGSFVVETGERNRG